MSYEEDYKNKPFASFLEDVVRALVGLDPESIMVCARLPGGETLTASYKVDRFTRWNMIGSLIDDHIIDLIAANKDRIAEENEDDL